MTISEFCEQRFLRYHAVSPGTRQEYGYVAKNHIVPYVGHLRISEVNRETFFNLLVNVLPAEEASQIGENEAWHGAVASLSCGPSCVVNTLAVTDSGANRMGIATRRHPPSSADFPAWCSPQPLAWGAQIARERTSAYCWRKVLSASQPVAVG